MNAWRWQGRDADGAWCTGVALAPDAGQLRHQLALTGIRLIRHRRLLGWRLHPSPRQLTWMLRHLHTLLDAGVPLLQALQALAREAESLAIGLLLAAIEGQLQAGEPLSVAFGAHPRSFDAGFCLAIEAGEQSGMLPMVLARLVSVRERQHRLQVRLRTALLYPAVILLMALAVLGVMVMVVLPALQQTFSGAGQTLPMATRALLMIGGWLRHSALGSLAALLLLFWLVRHGCRTFVSWRRVQDRLLLALPLSGALLRQAILVRWTQTLALLLGAGIPLIEALAVAARATGNRCYQEASHRLAERLSQGSSLTDGLQREPRFPLLLRQLAAVGEASGSLEQVFERAARYYDEQVDASLANLTGLLEPLAMTCLGALCALLIWALYVPLFQLGQVLA